MGEGYVARINDFFAASSLGAEGVSSLARRTSDNTTAEILRRKRSLRGSAATAPLHRADAALASITRTFDSLPEGNLRHLATRAAASAVQLTDGLHAQADRVLACEAALRALRAHERRAEVSSTITALVASMDKAVAALEDMAEAMRMATESDATYLDQAVVDVEALSAR